MQTTIKLQDLFTYSIIPILILLIPVVALTVYLILTRKKKEPVVVKNENVIKTPPPIFKNLAVIKNKYLGQLNSIEKDLKNNKIELRSAYQQISSVIRLFIFEVTDIKTQNYSLSEIKRLNIPRLYELIEEYYEPEFASKSEGDFSTSINKARRVIVEWK